jgi:type IV pilus assembly protein PilN
MIRINLLPVREKIKEENIRYQFTVGVLIIIFSIFLMGYFYQGLSRTLKEVKFQLNELKKENETLSKVVGDIKVVQKQKEDLQAKLKVIQSLSHNRLGIVMVLDAISDAKPEKLWLTKMEQIGPSVQGGDFELKLVGKAIDDETIAQFMFNLQKVNLLKGVDLISTKQVSEKGIPISLKEFEIVSKVVFGSKEKEKTEKGQKGQSIEGKSLTSTDIISKLKDKAKEAKEEEKKK